MKLTPQQAFDYAYNSYVPTHDDNPKNERWYRTYFAFKALLPALYTHHEHIIHQLASWCSWGTKGDEVRVAIVSLRSMLAESKPIPDPYVRHSYNVPPSPPNESDLVCYVRREYKRAYPERRWGSKHAKDSLERVREQATKILLERYESRLSEYEREESRIEEENQRRKGEHQKQLEKRETFLSSMRSAIEELNGKE